MRTLLLALLASLLMAATAPVAAHNGPSYEFTLCGPLVASGSCDLGTHVVVNGWGGSTLICCGYRGTITLFIDTIVQGGTPFDGTVLASYSFSCTFTNTTEHCAGSGIQPPNYLESLHAWCSSSNTAGQWGCYFAHT